MFDQLMNYKITKVKETPESNYIRPEKPNSNPFNQKNQPNKLGYRGVVKYKERERYQARITVNGVQVGLGTYDSLLEAALAYDVAARKAFGELAITNFVN